MDPTRQQKNAASDQHTYGYFEPSMDWVREPAADTLRVYLPGFRKEQLKVQVTSSRNLRISGERPLGDTNRISQFSKEISIASNYDLNEISAKFEKGILLIRHPKIIVPDNEPQQQNATQPQQPNPPAPASKETPKPQANPPKPAAKPPQAAVNPPKPPVDTPIDPTAKPTQAAVNPPKPTVDTPIKPTAKPPQAAVNPPKPPVDPPIKPAEEEAPQPQKPAAEPSKPAEANSEKTDRVDGKTKKGKDRSKYKWTSAGEKQENVVCDDVSCRFPDNRGRSVIGIELGMGNYKQILYNTVMELKKKPENFMNWVVVVLIVVLAIYAMKAMRPSTSSKSDN